MKLRFCLFTALIFICATSRAADFCVEAADIEKAYEQDVVKAVTKEEKAAVKKILKEEKDLVRQLLASLQETLDREEMAVVQEACIVINHDPFYTNAYMAYSAETDPAFSPRDQMLHSKKNPNNTIRLNVTEKFIKLLQYAKDQRPENATIQAPVLGYAGSYVVRIINIAQAYQAKGRRDLRNSLMVGKSVVLEGVQKMVSEHKDKVMIERAALEHQQKFIESFSDDGITEWAVSLSKTHPEFLMEKTVKFDFDEGKMVEVDPIFFDGQFRIGEIVRELSVQDDTFKNLDGIAQESIDQAKLKVQQLQEEWNRYINDSEHSKILQEFIMLGVLQPFIQRYNQELARIPSGLK